MPLPLILGAIAAIGGAIGLGAAGKGAYDSYQASKTVKEAKKRNEANIARMNERNAQAMAALDALGELELKVQGAFGKYADLLARVVNRPKFVDKELGGVTLPQVSLESLKDASVCANTALGTIGGLVGGSLSGVAAGGATTAAVMALGTASTGTAIASLSGAAATNATLAALGGGALSAGGGGMALGSAVLGASTLGIGLLIGGLAFAWSAGKTKERADQALDQMLANEQRINQFETFYVTLEGCATNYRAAVANVFELYQELLGQLESAIERHPSFLTRLWRRLTRKPMLLWSDFSLQEQELFHKSDATVRVLRKMTELQLVEKACIEGEPNTVNHDELEACQRLGAQLLEGRC